jgi:hypothetical protein
MAMIANNLNNGRKAMNRRSALFHLLTGGLSLCLFGATSEELDRNDTLRAYQDQDNNQDRRDDYHYGTGPKKTAGAALYPQEVKGAS